MTYPERQFTRSVLKHLLALGLLSLTLLVCCSCSSTKQVRQVVERSSVDTVYLSTLQYDSIYVYESHSSDYHPALIDLDASLAQRSSLGARPKTDTVFIKDVSVEYRYRLLHDTIRVAKCDSIPYEVVVTEIREVARAPTLFDRLCRITFWMVFVFVFVFVTKLIIKIRHP